MSALTDIGKFRKTLDDMIVQVKQWLERDQIIAIEKFEYKLNAGMKIDPRGSINLFVDSIIEYAHEILADNDKFFMDTDFEIESEFVELRAQIRSWWPKLDTEKQEYIRKRIKLLVMLGAICTKSEPLRQVINRFRDEDNPLEY
jgi:hypothetical protein